MRGLRWAALFIVALVSGCVSTGSVSSTASWPQPPLSFPEDLNFLLGRWDGEVHVVNDPFGPKRTLIIRSIQRVGDGWHGDARYGAGGSASLMVETAIALEDGRPVVKFFTDYKTRLDLVLSKPDALEGTFELYPGKGPLVVLPISFRRPVVPSVRLDLRAPPGAQLALYPSEAPATKIQIEDSGFVRVFLNPGKHELAITKEGFEPWTQTLSVEPNDTHVERTAVLVASGADAEAPRIALNYPPADGQIDTDEISVTGLITDNVELARLQVMVNGRELPARPDVAGKTYPLRITATLTPGRNVIELTAVDKAGNIAQVVRTVTRIVPALATPTALKVADRWAVVIGIGEYDNRQIPRLRYATADADAMYEFLTKQAGYPRDHVLLLTDTSVTKPTLLNIKRALGDFLARRTGRDDMVLIYFAGHGAPEVDVAGMESDGLSKYLIPSDADPDSLYTSALPMDEIQRIFARIPAERILLLLDTCYSGTAGGRSFARQQTRATGLNDQFLERLARSRGRVIITASGPNEVALELADLGHGLFTYYVLDGLRGKADRNGDGLVTVAELYEYVEDQVDRAARRAGGRQRPLMKGEVEGSLPLSALPQR